jgi:pyruvate dehydrogenase E2 component (dihydrolipoamide acetyltransferase)
MVMPQVSITSAEVKLLSWFKKPGDLVKRGEPVLEVETDKATVEIESYVDGYLRVTNYPEGAVVPLDAVIAVLTTLPDEKIEDWSIVVKEAKLAIETPTPVVEQSLILGRPMRGRLDISPIARKMAEDNNIDLSSIHGTGPEGRIIRSDIELALQILGTASGGAEKPAPPANPSPDFSPMRNAIAQRTVLSKASIPHYYLSIDIDMQAVLGLVSGLKKISVGEKAIHPTLTDIIIWVCGRTLPAYPFLHGSWTERGPQVNPEINIGMVVGLNEGLIVPIIHQVDRLSLSALVEKTHLLKQKAKQGGLSNRELTGGTFTVSNLGMFGVNSFIAVINPPESAILALGATIKQAVVNENDQVVVRPIMNATLSVDHRMIDGILAAKFLNALKETLEQPSLLLFNL